MRAQRFADGRLYQVETGEADVQYVAVYRVDGQGA